MSHTTSTIHPAIRNADGLAIIGRTRHALMGIRYTEGEGGGEGNDDGGDNGDKGDKSGSDAPWTKENFDPDRAFKLVENLRKDLAEQKTKTEAAITSAAEKARKDALADLATALGGGEQEETDPEKLKAKVTDLSSQIAEKDTTITKAQADVKAAQLEREVAILAAPLGANTKLLLANEEFKTSIASVEPTDEAAITAAITKALQANAALKQPPARSGAGDHTGPTVQSLESQLKAAEEKGDQGEIIRLTREVVAARRRAAGA